jgi:GT2 family glycosyltransferase
MKPVVSVVLGTFERLPFLKLTIASVREELAGLPSEIIVVDGGSQDGTLEWLMTQKDVVTIVQHNRGEWMGKPIARRSWGYFMNLAFKAAAGKYVCMVSDDCLLVPGAIQNGVRHFDSKLAAGEKVGAVAFYWRNWPEAKRYWVGRTLGKKIFVNHGLYSREGLEHVGFIDEDRYLFYHADGDLCLKLWDAGYICIDSPASFVEHYSHANESVRATNSERQKNDWNAYVDAWTGKFHDAGSDFTGDWVEVDFQDSTRTAEKFRPLMGLRRSLDDRIVQRGVKPALGALGILAAAQMVVRAIRGKRS